MGFTDGIYTIVCVADGGTPLVIPPHPRVGTPVECINGPSPTLIRIKHIGGDRYRLSLADSNDAPGNMVIGTFSDHEGTPMVVLVPEGAPETTTEWAIDPSGDDLHTIHEEGKNMYWSGYRDSPIILKGEEGARNQEWDIRPVDN
ncbi:unnamed protein product [Rhizoctonia solani]|uniref:Uncharacterized protein n=1 Tax=Rhizoctonia solani TaxID=456999 RepID=A0A8H3DPW5_9AGAM|nr:unnamed protein product [Rhizoctonia solani]CAE6531030.1 unnamed protein product [Rhizoctonia solani]